MGLIVMVTTSDVLSALETVDDPHMNISVVEMKMIRGVEISPEGDVTIGMVFPCIGCPAWTMIQTDIKEAVGTIVGVRSVALSIEWNQPWQKSDLSLIAREKIRSFGYQIIPME